MKHTILIVDDDEEICAELSEILRAEGYRTQAVYNGLDAVGVIEKRTFALVLLDLKLPGLTGFQVLDELRQKKPAMRVLVMTARPAMKQFSGNNHDEELAQEQCLRRADGLVHKPFDIPGLLRRIKDLLR